MYPSQSNTFLFYKHHDIVQNNVKQVLFIKKKNICQYICSKHKRQKTKHSHQIKRHKWQDNMNLYENQRWNQVLLHCTLYILVYYLGYWHAPFSQGRPIYEAWCIRFTYPNTRLSYLHGKTKIINIMNVI